MHTGSSVLSTIFLLGSGEIHAKVGDMPHRDSPFKAMYKYRYAFDSRVSAGRGGG